jgi:uncharacterized membrane protein YgcG
MQCPYCQSPAFETITECPRCGFSLDRVEAFFGVMPRLTEGISDLAGLFRPADARRITDASARLRERCPQVGCSIVTTSLAPTQPLTAYAFWLFNRGGICRNPEEGNKNRDLLLTLDAANARASLMIGYGLEPFVSRDILQDLINTGAHHFAREHWVDGIVAVLDATALRLQDISSRLAATYGLDTTRLRDDQPHPPDPHARRKAGV